MGWGQAGGERKNGVPLPTFPESTSGASQCVPSLKPPPKTSSRTGSLTERLGLCFSLLSVSGPGGVACQEVSLPLLQSPGTQEHKPPHTPQMIKGHLEGGSPKNQDTGGKNWGTRHL